MSVIDLSVCISVHNTEKYLPRCLDSVVHQSLISMEIILVNNGSTDNSLSIMRKYENTYKNRRILIVSQDDLGLAQGRQTGVDNANGKYITFLDADDYVELDAYQRLLDYIEETGADIVEGRTIRDNSVICAPYNGVQDSKEILKDFFKYRRIPMMLWLRIYRRELFDVAVFPQEYVNNEDNYAFPCLLYRANTIAYSDYVFHHYMSDNEQAVMNSIRKRSIDESKIIHNRRMILQSFIFVGKIIGKDTISLNFANEFKSYACNVCVEFCSYPFKTVSLKKRIKTVCDLLGLSPKDFTLFCKENNNIDNSFGHIANKIGILNALRFYTLVQKIRRR